MPVLDGKVAIVTGGGRGIGRAHALELARQGAAVLVNDLGGAFSGDGTADQQPAAEVAETIIAAGGRAVVDTTDISDWDAVGAIVDTAVREFGRLDIVVNNAGISRFATIDAVTRHDWERTIAVVLNGTAALTHWAAAHWHKTGPAPGRAIINTTSGVGLTPMAGNPMYAASKSAVAALTIASSIELAELGVRVNGIAPVARSRISEVVAGDLMQPVETGFDRMSPEHAATLAAHLASPLCRFTGRIFGIVGDDLTIYDGWTVGHHLDNGEIPWDIDSLQNALQDATAQQNVKQQGLKGVDLTRSPSDETLEALATAENSAG